MPLAADAPIIDTPAPAPARIAGTPQRGARSVMQSLAARLMIVGLNAGTGILTARALHPVGRGELAAVLLWPQMLSGALTFGLPSALTFNIRMHRDQASGYLLAALLLGLTIGGAGTGLAIWFAPYLLHQYSPHVVFIGRCLMPNLIIGIYLLTGRAALEADHRFSMSGLVLTATPLLTLAGLVGLVIAHALTPLTAGITYTLSGLPVFFFLWSRLPVRFMQPLGPVVRAGRQLMSYGIRSYGIDLCGTLGYYVDQALVVSLLSPESMGIYVVALSASRVLNVPQAAMASVLFPSLVGLPRRQMAALAERSLRFGSTLAIVSFFLVLLFGRLLLRTVYGPAFASVGLALALLTAEAALSGCVSILSQPFMATDRPGVITTQTVLGLACCVPCLLFFIPRLGVAGAALAILISTCVRFAFVSISFRRSFSGRWPRLLLDGDSLRWVFSRLSGSFPILHRLRLFAPALEGQE